MPGREHTQGSWETEQVHFDVTEEAEEEEEVQRGN